MVTFQSGDTQPVVADGYVIDGEALIFLGGRNEIVALFDINFIENWTPRSPVYELPLGTDA